MTNTSYGSCEHMFNKKNLTNTTTTTTTTTNTTKSKTSSFLTPSSSYHYHRSHYYYYHKNKMIIKIFICFILFLFISCSFLVVTSSSSSSFQNNKVTLLSSSSSAFQKQLYKSLYQEPYNTYPCQPRHIHLTQGTNVVQVQEEENSSTNDDDDYYSNNNNNFWWFHHRKKQQQQQQQVVSMIISFSIPSDISICRNSQPILIYGKQSGGKFHVISDTTPTTPTSTTNINNPIIEKKQFHYNSPKTGENYTSDWIYHITIPNVDAGFETYWYMIQIVQQQQQKENNNNSNWFNYYYYYNFLRGSRKYIIGESPMYTFRTPPKIGNPCTVALVGDLGQTYNSTKTMNHILDGTKPYQQEQEQLDNQSSSSSLSSIVSALASFIFDNFVLLFFSNNNDNDTIIKKYQHSISTVLLAGDLSYSDGEPKRWERWLELMEPLLRTTSLETAVGNHEIECDNSTYNTFIPYETMFRNPNRNYIQPVDIKPIPPKSIYREYCTTPSQFLGHYNYGNSFYDFQHGLIHIIVLNSYTNTTYGSIQYQYLQNLFESNKINRIITPWVLVMFHCPFHTTFIAHNNEINPKIMFDNMEPLFVKYNVNIILNGHDHAYMRTYPMIGNKLDISKKGPIYLTLGAGGNREEHTRGYIHNTSEIWVAKRDNYEYGFGKLYIPNATHAKLQWVRDGTTTKGIQDDVWLLNQYYS